jgi:primase-polymerase (primpol)-like protein
MLVLPPALAAMRAYRQFIVCKLENSDRRPGRSQKFPLHPGTLNKHNAHDPSIWMSFTAAASYVQVLGPGYGVGFVLTAADPFWFIDIDECWDEATKSWSDIAKKLVEKFEGAAVEVSVSLRGLHIIGSGSHGAGEPPPARKVCAGW